MRPTVAGDLPPSLAEHLARRYVRRPQRHAHLAHLTCALRGGSPSGVNLDIPPFRLAGQVWELQLRPDEAVEHVGALELPAPLWSTP